VIKNNLNPSWHTKLRVEPSSMGEEMRFEIYDSDGKSNNLRKHDKLGSAEASLKDVVKNGHPTELKVKFGHRNGGKLFVRAEKVNTGGY